MTELLVYMVGAGATLGVMVANLSREDLDKHDFALVMAMILWPVALPAAVVVLSFRVFR